MATTYELWDLEAGNMIGAYPSEGEALAAVRAGVADDGTDLWQAVGLRASEDDPRQSRRIAAGGDLIALAMKADQAGKETRKRTERRKLPASIAAEMLAKQRAVIDSATFVPAPLALSNAVQEILDRPQFGQQMRDFLAKPLVDPAILDALNRPVVDPAALDALTTPLSGEIARALQMVSGMLVFGDALLKLHAAGEAIAALVVAGKAKMSIGDEESLLEFPATGRVVSDLVAEGVLPARTAARRRRTLQLRVRGDAMQIKFAPRPEYRAVGD